MTDWVLKNRQGKGVGLIHDDKENGALVSIEGDKAKILARFHTEECEVEFVASMRALLEDIWQNVKG